MQGFNYAARQIKIIMRRKGAGMKKIGFVVLLIAIVSGIFLYLGLRDDNSGEKDDEVVLSYMGWGTELERKATEKLIREFEVQHPGIKVDYTHIPDDYDRKLERLIETGKEPDVAMAAGMEAMKMAEAGKLKNIAELAEKDEEYSLDDVLPQTVYWWEEGKALGVNSALEVNCLMYNKELAREAGVEVPTKLSEAWTWEEFVKAAQKLTIDEQGRNALDPEFDAEHIKCYGIKIEIQSAYLLSNLYAMSGERFLDETETKVNLRGTKALEGLQKVTDLINIYHVMPNLLDAKNLPNGAKALESEVTAMIWGGTWTMMDLAEAEVDYGLGVLPGIFGESVTISMGEPIVLFDSTNHPREAWELAKFFMNPEHSMELIENGLWMPVLKSWYEEPELLERWTKGNRAHPWEYREAVMEPAFQSCQPHWGYTVKNFGEMVNVFSPKMDEVWMGEITAEDAAASVEDEINALVEGEYPRP